jgi:hypothetical protein
MEKLCISKEKNLLGLAPGCFLLFKNTIFYIEKSTKTLFDYLFQPIDINKQMNYPSLPNRKKSYIKL